MPALRFKPCCLLLGNVWKREPTIIHCRILQRLRKKKKSIKRKIYSRENLNSYIQSQTTCRLFHFHGDLPITEMHRRTEQTLYIPFLLNLETRSDAMSFPIHLHFCETIPQARQSISYRRVCVNNGMVSITYFKVSHGDIKSFQENYVRTRNEEIRRFFYIEISIEKIIGKFLDHLIRMWRRTKTEWFCLLLKSQFLQHLHSYMQEEDLERTKKFGSKKVCLGSSFAEHNRMKRNLYHFKSLFLSKRRKEKNQNILTRTKSPIVYNSSLYSNASYCFASPHQFTMTRKIKRIKLPTHDSEVNHRTPKAVVSYGPNTGHIPHDIRLKDPNLLRSGNRHG